MARKNELPVVLVKWYDFTKWLLERIDNFPKSHRFIFGQWLADHAIDVMELLIDAAYSAAKSAQLVTANRRIEVLRWLARLAHDRRLFSVRRYGFCCRQLTECGRMVGGWLKHSTRMESAANAST